MQVEISTSRILSTISHLKFEPEFHLYEDVLGFNRNCGRYMKLITTCAGAKPTNVSEPTRQIYYGGHRLRNLRAGAWTVNQLSPTSP
jgi:hypothetical protein